MPTGTPNVPLDSNGRPLAGRALEVHLRKQAELDAAASYAEDIRAMARIVCRLASRAMGSMPAPDALAVLGAQAGPGGQDDALRTLRAAGFDPDPQAQRWAEEAPRQFSSRTGDLYAGDPAHDPRVMEAVLAGRSMAEVADITAEVAAERRQAHRDALTAAAAAGHSPDVLWATRTGEVVRQGGAATPFMPQRSVVRRDVAALGEEPVPPEPPLTYGA